jgi:predicted metalloendopeptidase
MQTLLWVAITPMLTTTMLTSCTDDNNEDSVIVVTDDKPFPYDTDIDETVRPGDDFYRYVNGLWLNSPNPSPSIMKQVEDQLKQVSDEAFATSQDPLLVMLRSQADATLADDSRNVALLKERLQMLEQIETADQLHAAFGTLYELGYSTLFRLIPLVNEGKKVALTITTSGMPEEMLQVFMRKKTEKIDSLVRAYCQPLSSLGYTSERAAEIIKNAIKVETTSIQCYKKGYEMVQYRLHARRRASEGEELNQKISAICEMMGLTNDDLASGRLVQTSSELVQLLIHFACVDNQDDINAYRDYMIYNVVAQDGPFIPSANAQADRKAMLQRALQYNRYYKYRQLVEYYGKDNIYKQECQDILERMRQIFIQRIDSLDWMSDATKVEARRKAQAMKFYIGYPDTWNDAMTPVASGDCLLETVTQLRQDAVKKNLAMGGMNLEENPWSVWATIAQFTTDNAFYQGTANSLVILPAWITRPRFDSSLSEATFYTTSYVFGHEFCHGFDAMGSLLDADGMQRDWWEPADKEAFQQKQQAMIDLFSQLEAYPGQNVNGKQTLIENMADYGGVELALECYKQRLAEQGFSGEQFDEQIKKFFLAYAQLYKDDYERSPEKLKEMHDKRDIHSLHHNRINGMMRLQADWYRLYDVQPTDKLYLAPEQRVKIW